MSETAPPSLLVVSTDRGAWQQLSARLRPYVARRVERPSDVEDVMQDILLRMHRGLGDLRDAQRFGPWVYQVARSAIADHHRHQGRLARHERLAEDPGTASEIAADAVAAEQGFGLHDEEERMAERMLAASIAPFVAMLPAPYREALTLTELEGLTQKEAAQRLGLSHSGMKSRVQRGRQKLRAALEDCCHIVLDARQRVVACTPRPDGRLPDGSPVLPRGRTGEGGDG